MNDNQYDFENFTISEYTIPAEQYNPNNAAYLRRKKRKRRQKLLWGGVALVLLLLTFFTVILFKFCMADGTLIGKWSIDDITVYEFREGGEGAMILPYDNYEFTYTLNGDKISIDFESEFATDKSYTYELKGNKLILTGEGKFGGIYEMTRIKEK